MATLPTDFKLDPETRELTLTWTDGEVTRHDYTELRRLCPCANCEIERNKVHQSMGLRILSGTKPRPAAPLLLKVQPIGRYALRFDWEDGHSAGIYPFVFLREHAKK